MLRCIHEKTISTRVLPYLILIAVIVLSGCNSNSVTDDKAAQTEPDQQSGTVTPDEDTWFQPVTSTRWHLQLQGTVNSGYDVTLYDIDLNDSPVSLIDQLQSSGRKVICYFSAGSFEDWRYDSDSFAAADIGKPLDAWPGENWLDIRSDNVREIMNARMDLAVEKGCDGVDPDNMEGYSIDSGIDMTKQDQIEYNHYIAEQAHSRGLSVGLKNGLEMIDDLVMDFDFAVNEQRAAYDECDLLQPFTDAGKQVFHVEYDVLYQQEPGQTNLCDSALARNFSTLILPLALDDSFRIECQ